MTLGFRLKICFDLILYSYELSRDYICFRASKKIPIKMGWLEKKGEHLKLWRRRFLVLYDDGVFNGYKAAPSEEDIKTGSGTLENLFNVKSELISVI